MTKAELIKRLENIDDDKVLVIMMEDGGWFNIGTVLPDGSITADSGRPFTSDNS